MSKILTLDEQAASENDALEESSQNGNVVIISKNGTLAFSGMGFSPVGYHPGKSVTWEEWVRAGDLINAVDRFKNFAIGDWINAGEGMWGETYAAALDVFKWGELGRLQKLAWVARSVPLENRRTDITWSHHAAVAHLTYPEQRDWLEFAAINELTVSELKARIKEMLQAAAVAMAGQANAVSEEPEYPAEVDMGNDTADAAGRPGIPATTSQYDGWDSTSVTIDGHSTYDEQEDVVPGQSGVFITDDPKAAAKKMLDTLGDTWCLQMIEHLGFLIGDQYLD